MAVYPAQLTTEEKNLKKRYARLQEKVLNVILHVNFPLLISLPEDDCTSNSVLLQRKQLRKLNEKASKDHGSAGPSSSPVKLPQKGKLPSSPAMPVQYRPDLSQLVYLFLNSRRTQS